MQRPLIFFALILLFVCSAAAADTRITIQGEHRRDAVDIEEETGSYYREKLKIAFSPESAFSLTTVHRGGMEGRRHTWNLVLGDIGRGLFLVTGNFYVNFGIGLLMGTAGPFQPDPFSRKGNAEDRGVFSPSTSGNPASSFHGIGAGITIPFSGISCSFHTFYSRRERFISSAEHEEGHTESSISSLEGHCEPEGMRGEPVHIQTAGGACAVTVGDYLTLGSHCIYSDLETPEGGPLLFSYSGSDGNGAGYTSFSGYGFRMEYRDENLTLFAEQDITRSCIVPENRPREEITGKGTVWGMKLSLPLLRTSIVRKFLDRQYYSPFTATIGETGYHEGWFWDLKVSPFRNLRVSSGVSSERRLVPSVQDEEPPVTVLRTFSGCYSWKALDTLQYSAAFLERTRDGADEEKQKHRFLVKIRPLRQCTLQWASAFQKTGETGTSSLHAGGIGITLFRRWDIAITGAKAVIAPDNPVYARMLPMRNSNIPGFFIRENAIAAAVRTSLRWGDCYFSLRYFYLQCEPGENKKTVEFFGRGTF
ncbi:MAG TPA: hypothetical protein PK253_17235 [Spirochaetota bacterium]|nr:hypothetical protein [Spirochaetota bacterium]